MGKRELVLISLFMLAGIVVYQITAPPAAPGSDLSVGGIFQHIRRSVQGPRETAAGESRRTVALGDAVRSVRINLPRPSDLTITAGDRDDLAIEIRTSARGYTQAEAKAAADAATVTADAQIDTVTLNGSWEDHRGPAGYVTQASVEITVPRRLRVSVLPHIGLLAVKNVASLEVTSSRGETHILDTAGDIRLTQSNGSLEVSGGGSLKLTTRSSRGEVARIRGLASVDTTGSQLKLAEIAGPVDIESRNSDCSLEKIGALKPPFRYNGTGGELRIEGLRTEARIDGHNTDMSVALAAAAPVTIYNLGAVSVTAPPDGYTLDAIASEGHITVDEPDITATEGPDSHASGKIRGGGPALTLRATRGRIDIRRAPATSDNSAGK
jgi:hypothetical protein